MDSKFYVDSNENQFKIGDKVKFSFHYHKDGKEEEGVVVSMNQYCQVVVKLPRPYMARGRDGIGYMTDTFTMHGSYDHKSGLVIFGVTKQVFMYDELSTAKNYSYILRN
jgi:hypothetical protein